MLHCEIVLFFIFAYKQKAPSFAEIRRMWAFDHIKRYNLFPLFSQIGQHGAAQAHRCSERNSSPAHIPFCRCLPTPPRNLSLGFISTQPFITKPAERGSKAHSPVFAWCLFGVYYYSEILSAVPTYPPKTA